MMAERKLLLGLDVGSSFVKASLVEVDTRQPVVSSRFPTAEMPIHAAHPGWAEQDPEMWWRNVILAVRECLSKLPAGGHEVAAIGIAYQMHGLVIVGKNHEPIRPSIIWCDSRAVNVGEKIFQKLGSGYCMSQLLNSPGNFTASKLRWIKEMEPTLFDKIEKAMLPGDYIAMKLTGEILTTQSGLSEGIFWDYEERAISIELLKQIEIGRELLPNLAQVFSVQGNLRNKIATELGLPAGIPVSYRAGDQTNNAFSLKVLNPGEAAATAGTSGVVYAVTDQNLSDAKSRVNTFLHVNDVPGIRRNGVLLCVNGAGIMNSWLKRFIQGTGSVVDYDRMNYLAARAPIGCRGLQTFPFGNGAERIFENKILQASMRGLDFNRHDESHLLRSAQEGIAYAMSYGFEILKEVGTETSVVRAGKSNLFLSSLFREAFVNTTGVNLELYDTNGAQGAALGAGVGVGAFQSVDEALAGLRLIEQEAPEKSKQQQYQEAYQEWKRCLPSRL